MDGYLVKPFEAEQVRACIAPLLDAGDSDNISASAQGRAEPPQETMTRLNIDTDRLLVYLGGFQSQLAGASSDIGALLARGDHDAARLRLDRLHAGCLTLGLNDSAQVQVVLAETVHSVMRQSDAVKRLAMAA